MKQMTILLIVLISCSIAFPEKVASENTVMNYYNTMSPSHNDDSEDFAPPGFMPNDELSNLEGEYENNVNLLEKPPGKKPNKLNKKKKNNKKRRIRKRKVYKDPIQIIKEGWLRISTHHFRNQGRYPPINLPDWSEAKISHNADHFRINESYDKSQKGANFPPSKFYFWFRLSGKNFYYSQNPNDMNVLGSLASVNVIGSTHDRGTRKKSCFNIKDREGKEWTLCARKVREKYEWICKIKEMLGFTKIRECIIAKKKGKLGPDYLGGEPVENKPTTVTRKVTTPIILIPLPSKNCNEGWDYSNKGQDWNCECSEGKEQSPINLPPRDKAILSPIKPIFSFNEVESKKEVSTSDGQHKTSKILSIKNKNHALRIKHKYFGKTVTLDGGLYTAEEIVFHTPAEHTIDGKRFDMEMQIIHYGKSSGDIAKQLVLSFVFERKAGVYNKFIDDLDFFNLPNPVTKKRALLNSLFIPKIFYASDYEETPLLKPFSFYTYQGSLTQPPCSERTIFYVAAKPIKLGSSALQLFQEAIRIPDVISSTGDIIRSVIPPENNRILQPLNGRAIFYYEFTKFCTKSKSLDKVLGAKGHRKVKGHYEKVLKRMTDYYYVSGPKPSGLPGAYVVSRQEAEGNLGDYN